MESDACMCSLKVTLNWAGECSILGSEHPSSGPHSSNGGTLGNSLNLLGFYFGFLACKEMRLNWIMFEFPSISNILRFLEQKEEVSEQLSTENKSASVCIFHFWWNKY